MSFVQFDICEFYPSITKKVLLNALNHAKTHAHITKQEIEIILSTKSGILFSKNQAWAKKGNQSFDITMGSWDGAEVCDLVGMFLLSQLGHLKLNIGLYRDDGLAVSNLGPRQTCLAKKKISKIFKDNGFNLTFEEDGKSVNFLDVTFNLENNTFEPYMKPNHSPVYVHKESNHPPKILKNIPVSVNKRLCAISSNEEVFRAAIPPFQQALKNSGYDHELKYTPETQANTKKKKNRKRKVTYFNPPFSINVKTNIGEKFLKLINKCFPKSHPLSKIINRNTIKVSYKCMPNFKSKIARHNQKLLNNQEEQNTNHGCNCTNEPCPLETENCQSHHVVYRATVEDENQNIKTYTGLTRNTFKRRFSAHKYSFNHRGENSTTLSTHLWKLKDENTDFTIRWNIIDRASEFNPTTRKCRLCDKEKYYIIFEPDGANLNLRSELFSTCRHRLRLLLNNT